MFLKRFIEVHRLFFFIVEKKHIIAVIRSTSFDDAVLSHSYRSHKMNCRVRVWVEMQRKNKRMPAVMDLEMGIFSDLVIQ